MYLHYVSANYDIARNISHVKTNRFLIHSHPYYELHYFVQGDVEIISSGRIIALEPHGITLFAPNMPHGLRVLSERPYERYTVHFTEDVLRPESSGMLLRLFNTDGLSGGFNHIRYSEDGENVRYILQELVRLYTFTQAQQEALAPALIEAVLASVYAMNAATMTHREGMSSTNVPGRQILDYVNAHYTERLSLEKLANLFFCSKNHLNQLFRDQTGLTVMRYISKRRLDYAHMLMASGYTAAASAVEAGFSDYSSFYRAYVKQYAYPPSRRSDAFAPEPRLSEIMPEIGIKTINRGSQSVRNSIWERHRPERGQENEGLWIVRD